MKGKIKKSRIQKYSIVLFVILTLYVISMFVPLFWGLLTSFKGKLEYRTNMFGFPNELLWSNYSIVFEEFFIEVTSGDGLRPVYIPEMLMWSLLYAGGCAFIQTFTQLIMAYVCEKFPYRFSKLIYSVVLVTMVLPIVGSLPSEIQMANALNLRNQIYGLYIMKTSFLGMYFLVFYSALKTVPKDFSEAAYIDGAGNFTVFFTIVFPIMRNTFLTVVLLSFIGYWNDYQTPLIYMPNLPTLAYGLYYFTNICTINAISGVPIKLAACMMMCVPTLILFVAFHNKLIGNVSLGGLKE